jgi:hypothetical protein
MLLGPLRAIVASTSSLGITGIMARALLLCLAFITFLRLFFVFLKNV